MNNLLEVKLRYNHEGRKGITIYNNLRSKNETTVQGIEKLEKDLKSIIRYYEANEKFVKGYLVDVNYNDVISKSKRISELLKPDGKTANDIVVGARFSDAQEGKEYHIITYYVDYETINSALEKLEEAKRFLIERLEGKANEENFNEKQGKRPLNYSGFSKNRIRKTIVDCSVVTSFSIPNVSSPSFKKSFLITFFQTERSVTEILEKLEIDSMRYQYSFYGKDTISVTWDLYQSLVEKVPYMISMISSDLAQISPNEIVATVEPYYRSIPKPQNEPIIGVIDNLFDTRAYFSEWVESIDYLDEYESLKEDDTIRKHGTEVSSIIVDGPSLNPWLEDGCGRFRVKHFGVCENRISVPRLVNKIIKIVDNNPDIHVWNLSLGTDDEVSKNFISYDAAVLDELQNRKNIIFVVSGTNDNRAKKEGYLRVGSPADSLNAVVVNSVKRSGIPASYSRRGNVLSFFNKPDVSYYGGDYEGTERIKTCSGMDIEYVYGTSFAAPWIARKLAFLIDIMGLPREIAKALIIDSAANWEYKKETHKYKDVLGYGIVPIKIEDILSTDSGEIKFTLYGTTQTYKTSNYAIPVPKDSDSKYPYIARATLCYFPECVRSQGVDYTSRELSLSFGRINNDGRIEDINDNVQDNDAGYSDERKSRKEFRKWENTKFISKVLKANKPLKSYGERMWGIAIVSKERLTTKMKSEINFGVVITLREINGVNRIQEFISACSLRGWIVNEVSIENRIEVYNRNQEEITVD